MGIVNMTRRIEPAKTWPGRPDGAITQEWTSSDEDGMVWRNPHYLPPEKPIGEEHFPGIRLFRAVSAWMPLKLGRVLLVLHRGGPGDSDTIASVSDDAILTEQVAAALDYVHGRKSDWVAIVAAARKQRDRHLASWPSQTV